MQSLTFEQVKNYNLTHITKYYAKKYNVSLAEAKRHELEIKRYLFLSSKRAKDYGMSGIIDEYWHTFILFTEDYHSFCTFLGCGYIHHIPATTKLVSVLTLK